jgi:hypothetical protein
MAETFREATLLVPAHPDDLRGDLPGPQKVIITTAYAPL